jgi:hypothetical protein
MATADGDSPDPETVSWTAPDLREHLPSEHTLPERGLEAAICFIRNPDASGLFVADDLGLARRSDPIRETLRALLAYPLDARQPRDAKHPSDPTYSTGVTPSLSAETFAGLSPNQRGVIEVAARDESVLARADDPGSNLPASDICRRAKSLGFDRPHNSYPSSVLGDYRDIADDRRAVLAARGDVDAPSVLAERLDAVMDADTDTPARALLEAAGWFLPDHNLDTLPTADDSATDDLHPGPDEEEANRRALTPHEAAAAGSPVPWAPDAIGANDPRIGSEGARPLGDERPKAIPTPWPLVRSVLAPPAATNRTVAAGVPYAAVINGVREGFGAFVNLDSDVFDVNGLIRSGSLPEAASETDFEQGDRVTVYLRERSKLDASDSRDVDLEFVLAPRTVAERWSAADAEEYAICHTSILPGEGPPDETPAPVPDPEDGLKADPDEMLLSPPVGEGDPELEVDEHARNKYASRARIAEADRPDIETAWAEAESVNPEPFAEVEGDRGVPDAARYHPDANVTILRRGDRLVTTLGGWGHNAAATRAVRAIGYDPNPGPDMGLESDEGHPSIRPAVRPILGGDAPDGDVAITDSRARDPPGFISEWPAPDPRTPPAEADSTPAVRRVPRDPPTGLPRATVRLPPEPRTPPAEADTVPAVEEVTPDPTPADGGAGTAPEASLAGLPSFDRVRDELDRLEAAGHEVVGVSVDADAEGVTLSVSTEARES